MSLISTRSCALISEPFWRDGQEHIEQAGGFARVAAAIAQIRKERGGQVLVLDAGDTIQGSGAAALTEGRAVVGPLNALGLDAAIPGNWEVVYGAAVLKQRARELRPARRSRPVSMRSTIQ